MKVYDRGSNGENRCDSCGTLYFWLIPADNPVGTGSFACEECGAVIDKWQDGHVPKYSRIERSAFTWPDVKKTEGNT